MSEERNVGARGSGRGGGRGVGQAPEQSPGQLPGHVFGPGRGRGSPQKGSSELVIPPTPSPPLTSSPRPPTIHADPFPNLTPSKLDVGKGKGPPDPHQAADKYNLVMVKPIPDPTRPPAGFGIYEPQKLATYPGVSWHWGVMNKKNGQLKVFVRKLNERHLKAGFMAMMDNERKILSSLDHKFILKIIGSYKTKNDHGDILTLVVFRSCDKDLETEINETRKGMKEDKAIELMAQVAQAVAFMHDKNYVHTRIHPSSIRREGTRHARLSRFMCASKWSESKPGVGPIPGDMHEHAFLSPERFWQELPYEAANQLAKEGLVPQSFPGRWDGKKDDVWAFGCVVFFILSGSYPYEEQHRDLRKMMHAIKNDYLIQRIANNTEIPSDARKFLRWILNKNPQARPTMEQVVHHPWFQSKAPTSPHKAPHLKTGEYKEKDFAKTFRIVPGHISDDLVNQMTAEGYSLQYVIGQGSFGAVYKGMKFDNETGRRRPIAMKMIKGDKSGNTFKNHRWLVEYKIMTELKHPNIVEVLSVFKEIKRPQHGHSIEGRVFVFMELATMDLNTLIKNKGTIPEQELRPLMVQVVEGLVFLRKNKIAHRDLKPHNILILGPNENIAKVTDYSLVREADSHTISNSIVGTRVYMAPELHLREPITDVFKLDVFSLGLVMFESLMGRRPNWDPDKGAKEARRLNDGRPFIVEYIKLVQDLNSCSKSPGAISLMKGMLDQRDKRFNWKQVQKHQWMIAAGSGQSSPSPGTSGGGSSGAGGGISPAGGISPGGAVGGARSNTYV